MWNLRILIKQFWSISRHDFINKLLLLISCLKICNFSSICNFMISLRFLIIIMKTCTSFIFYRWTFLICIILLISPFLKFIFIHYFIYLMLSRIIFLHLLLINIFYGIDTDFTYLLYFIIFFIFCCTICL